MNPIEFREPNFRCRITEMDGPDGKQFWRLCYAEDETKARKLLEGMGLVVHTIEPYSFGEGWLERAKEETEKVVAARHAGQVWEFKPLWRDLKDHLLDLFHGKCAYCEAVCKHVGFVNISHYRPKAKVAEDPSHPGYYWLAYDPHNYLPSCQRCNQAAKRAHFPIADSGVRAYGPGDSLEDEKPLLLNPMVDDYSDHLRFFPSVDSVMGGRVKGTTEQGEKMIEILDLNRQELVDERLRQQTIVRSMLKTAYVAALVTEDKEAVYGIISEIESDEGGYSLASLCEVKDFRATMSLIFDSPQLAT